MNSWVMKPLGAVIELQRGHDLPFEDRRVGVVPIIGSFGVTGFHDQAKYAGPGVAIGRSGASIGRATYVEGDYWPLNTALFVKDFKGNVPYWTYLALRRIDFTGFNSGSAQPSLNRNFLGDIPVMVPPRQEQEAIAEVLGALDDKIAVNAKIAETADELVRAMFSSLDNQGTIPLGSLCASIRDQVTPMRGVPYVGLEHVPRRHMWLSGYGDAGSVASAKVQFNPGDVLFGKLRPYFHKVVSAPVSGVASTDILVLRALDSSLAGFLLAAASSDAVVAACSAASAGTRMPRTKWADVSSCEIAWPGAAAASEMSRSVDALKEVVNALIRESRTLAELRDTLLPALMDGTIRVKDAVAAAEEVL